MLGWFWRFAFWCGVLCICLCITGGGLRTLVGLAWVVVLRWLGLDWRFGVRFVCFDSLRLLAVGLLICLCGSLKWLSIWGLISGFGGGLWCWFIVFWIWLL